MRITGNLMRAAGSLLCIRGSLSRRLIRDPHGVGSFPTGKEEVRIHTAPYLLLLV